jgi:hypothetical protein
MKRYYLSKIKAVEIPGMGTAYRHRLQEYADATYAGGEIAVDPITGIPTQKALLVLVGAKVHSRFVNDPELIEFPLVSLDSKVSTIHTPTKTKCKNDIVALGLTKNAVDNVWDNADGLRDVINHYGRLNTPAFDANDFDLDEN